MCPYQMYPCFDGGVRMKVQAMVMLIFMVVVMRRGWVISYAYWGVVAAY